MGFVLHESQSQTGYLSVAVGEVLLLAVFPAQRRTLLLLLLPLAIGMIAGALARHFLSVVTINHLTTSQVRWTVLKASLALFAERPWTGWGVGSFAAVFLERAGPLRLSSISHPHNELALWLVEGGLIGLLGRFVLWRVVYGSGCTAIAGIAPAWWRRYPWLSIC